MHTKAVSGISHNHYMHKLH